MATTRTLNKVSAETNANGDNLDSKNTTREVDIVQQQMPTLAAGEYGILFAIFGPNLRTNLVQSQEIYAVVGGLMLTVSAAAVFTPQCTLRTKSTSTNGNGNVILSGAGTGTASGGAIITSDTYDDASITCTTIQSADSIIWTCALLLQLATIVSSWGYFALNALLNDTQLRQHLLNNFRLYI